MDMLGRLHKMLFPQSSARAYCADLVEAMKLAWQRLPRSSKLGEAPPIPLQTASEVRVGYKVLKTGSTFCSPEEAIETILEKETDHPLAILVGEAGAGKSAALKWTTCKYAKRFAESSRARDLPAPVYEDLGRWKTVYARRRDLKNTGDILDEIKRRQLGRRRNIIWFLDGLDLLPDSDKLSRAAVLETAWQRANKEEGFVLSTRPMTSLAGALPPGTRLWQLALRPLDRDFRKAWVIDNYPEAEPGIQRFVEVYPHHAGLLDTPMFFVMVLSTCLDYGPGEEPPFKWDDYPGLAGMLKGFVTYALLRAHQAGRISSQQRHAYELEYAEVVEGVFWAALACSDERDPVLRDRVLADGVGEYLAEVFGRDAQGSKCEVWRKATPVLEEAGLLRYLDDEGAWGVAHQLFAEYWAAGRLAWCLKESAKDGCFEVELWDQLKDKDRDLVTAQALAILSGKHRRPELVRAAFDTTKACSAEDALMLMAEVGSEEASDIVVSETRSQDARTLRGAARALGKLKSDRAVESLKGLLLRSSTPWFVREEAAQELGRMGGERVVDPLHTALRDEDARVVTAAATALHELDPIGTLRRLLELAEDDSAEASTRLAALNAAGKLRDGRLSERLKKLRYSLPSFEPPLSKAAELARAKVMYRRGHVFFDGEESPHAGWPGESIPHDRYCPYCRCNPNLLSGVRYELLGEVYPPWEEDTSPRPQFCSMCRPETAMCPEYWGLAHFHEHIYTESTPMGPKPMDFEWAEEDMSYQYRDCACQGLAASWEMRMQLSADHFDPARARQSLDERARQRAVDVLVKMANAVYYKRSTQRQRIGALWGLCSWQPELAVAPLLHFLESSCGAFRFQAQQIFGHLEGDKVLDALLPHVRDVGPLVRKTIASALGRSRSQRAVEPLIELVATDEDEEVRQEAADALGNLIGVGIVTLEHVTGEARSEAPNDDSLYALLTRTADRLQRRLEPWGEEGAKLEEQRKKKERKPGDRQAKPVQIDAHGSIVLVNSRARDLSIGTSNVGHIEQREKDETVQMPEEEERAHVTPQAIAEEEPCVTSEPKAAEGETPARGAEGKHAKGPDSAFELLLQLLPETPPELMATREELLCALGNKDRSTVHRWQKDLDFPKPIGDRYDLKQVGEWCAKNNKWFDPRLIPRAANWIRTKEEEQSEKERQARIEAYGKQHDDDFPDE